MLFFNEAFLDIFNLFYLFLQSSHIPSFILQLLAELLLLSVDALCRSELPGAAY